jgi:hypothetical protein
MVVAAKPRSLCSHKRERCRVARCYIFIPKISIWVNFSWPWNLNCWCMLWPFGILFYNLVYFSRFGILYHERYGNPQTVLKRQFINDVIVTQSQKCLLNLHTTFLQDLCHFGRVFDGLRRVVLQLC